MNLKSRIKKFLDKEGRPPLFTLKIYKRHLILFAILAFFSISVYGTYLRYFTVLPQNAVNVMPKFDLSLESQKVLEVSPHCDDEVLGAGGLMQKAVGLSSEVRVVMVTDCNKHKIGSTRKEESKQALSSLGISSDKTRWLDFPEGESNKTANAGASEIKSALEKEINDFNPTLVVSPHPEDTHIDHRTAGEAINSLKSDKYHVVYYLIHYNFLKYPSNDRNSPHEYLLPPARLITFHQRWYILDLTETEEEKKQSAVLMYRSQLSMKNPILRNILLDFIRKNELFMIEE